MIKLPFDFYNVRLIDGLLNSEVLLHRGENVDGCTGPKVEVKVVGQLNKANYDIIGKPNGNP